MTKKYSFIQEEYSDDEKQNRKVNTLSAISGNAAAGLVPAIVSAPLARTFHTGNSKNYYESPLPDYLKNLKVNDKQNISDYMKEKGIRFSKTATKAGPHFNTRSNVIALPIKDKYGDTYGKSIFAHELGHSAKLQNNKGRILTYGASKHITNAAALAQFINCFNKDDESRRKAGKAISLAGGAAAIPMIAEEIGASLRGSKMLGLKGKDKARSLIGVGSYIAVALSPAIMYHVSERTRNFLKRMKKIKNESPEVQNNVNILKKQDIKVEV